MNYLRTVLMTACICTAISMSSQAQARFGLAGGINWASLGDVDFGSVSAAYESKMGWHLGLFADVKILLIGVRPGVYYVNAGPLLEVSPEDSELRRLLMDFFPEGSEELSSFNVTYVSVPIDVKVGLPLAVLEPYLFVGPEFKFSTVSGDEGPFADQIESTVVAGNAGFGLGLGLGGNVTLYPEFRFGFDISGIFGDSVQLGSEEVPTDDDLATTVMVRLGVGL